VDLEVVDFEVVDVHNSMCDYVDTNADVILNECSRMIMNVLECSRMFSNDPWRKRELWILKCGNDKFRGYISRDHQ
jgi:hypothetical protein